MENAYESDTDWQCLKDASIVNLQGIQQRKDL